jgi:subtilisin family serine protease
LERQFRTGLQVFRVSGMSVEDAVAHFASNPRVEYAEPDYIIAIDQSLQNLPSDPRIGELYGLDNQGQTGGTPDADIDAAEAWAIQTGGEVLIGVIDTGVDWHHEDLADNIWTNPGEIPDNGVDDDNNGFVDDVHGWDFVNNDNDPMDDHRHGTHVSGTIAAVGNNGIGVAGVCWKAILLPIKILNANGTGSTSQAIAGIEYSALMGARITNNSWGSAVFSRALDETMAALVQTNAVFVAAAGNNGLNNDFFPHYPASYEYGNIISVANTDHDDALFVTSNFGAVSVDLAAPGSLILSLEPGNEYGVLSGTSMSAPHVTGTVGLILSEAPLMTSKQVKAHLMATVDPMPVLDGKTVSGGRLNAYNALNALDATPPQRIADLRVDDRGSNTITLTWTASGDDGDVGTAAAYDIRYATAPIKKGEFDQTAQVHGAPRPSRPGTQERFRVNGLDVKTTYFFAIRASDERLNVSETSNMAVGNTRGTPELAYTPDAFEGAALSGAKVFRTLRITNTGKGSIDFAFEPSAHGWVTVNPGSGTVNARESAEVTVMLDALGLPGGEHNDVLTLTSNDPERPTVELPARLSVTSAPDVEVSDTSVDFGALFVGALARREIRVANRGDLPLEVTLVAVADTDAGFRVDVDPFTLQPSGEKTVAIDFVPPFAKDITASLQIACDDPDESTLPIALTGRGLPPPDISVAPAQLAAQLRTGAASLQTVTIVNQGASDLEWTLSVERDGDRGEAPEGPFRDLTGVRILYDAAHGNLHWFNYNIVFTDLKSRGAEIVVSPAPITREHLADFDVVWMAEAWILVAPEEREALVGWVRAGGGLLLEGDYDRSVPNFNGILQGLLSGIEMSFDHGASGITNNIEKHETTRGVGNVFLNRVTASLAAVRPPGQMLIYDVAGGRNMALSRAGTGRLVMMADQNFANHRIGLTGNLLLANRVIDWLALGVTWLDASPSEGVLSPGESQILDVKVDAIGLGGPFEAHLVARSNDPDQPALVLPVHLEAIPAADIVVGESGVRLPRTALGRSSERKLTVGNAGTMDLDVTDVTTLATDFTVTPSSFKLPPGGLTTLTVAYTPTSAGKLTAALEFFSDDPDERVKAIDISGIGYVGTPGSITMVNQAGVNLRSWNLDTEDDTPGAILAGVMPQLVQAVGYEDGQTLLFHTRTPEQHLTLKKLDHLRAYWIEMSAEATLTIEGLVVDPQTPIPLDRGWNMISYLPDTPDTPENAMQSVFRNLVWMFGYEDEGLMYMPRVPEQFSTLKQLKPTYGYWIKMAAADTLVYPDTVATTDIAKAVRRPNIISPARRAMRHTREWIGLWGSDVTIDGRAVDTGTIVTARDRGGVVCGECVVATPGEFGLMAVYRDDPETAVDEGADPGEPLTLSIGDKTFAGVRWTEAGDVIEFNAVATMTSVPDAPLPELTALHQNYPNPFNPSTAIRYDVSGRSAVTLIVYNVRGQVVRTLVDEVKSPGKYTTTWSGISDAGERVATGVYFYRLVAGHFTQTRKMVVLK